MPSNKAEGIPALSVVVAIVSDTTGPADATHLAQCLEAFSNQLGDVPVELIVPHLEEVRGLEDVKQRFPHVNFLPVTGLSRASAGGREHHDILRAHGLLAARGEYVTLVEDHAKPDPMYCANILSAHLKNDAVIGGAIENSVDRPINWAVYFCDFGKYQNPVPEGDSPFASDANVSYRRSMLDSVRQIWESSYREIIVNNFLRSRKVRVTLCPDIVVYQNRTDLTLGAALRERFIWGRSFADARNLQLSGPKRLVYALMSPILPVMLTARIGITAWKRRRLFSHFLKSMPLIGLLQIGWSLGEGLGYLFGLGNSPLTDTAKRKV